MAENIKDALSYAVELADQESKIIKSETGKEYYDSNRHSLCELNPRQYAPVLNLHTLRSLVDYLKSDNDIINSKRVLVVVESPQKVSVYDQVDFDYGRRNQLVYVQAAVPRIPFDNWHDQEEFNIMLQSMFIDDADRSIVLDFASHLKIEKGAEVQDNGVSQMATVRDGVASLSKAKTPNPVTLRPYRTFNEVEQPASQFIFRINKLADLALFEADGGKWQLEAISNIASYLTKELVGNDKITILA
ncbi:hypothetical protein ACVRXQ_12005 [Streptococcus panodentis]|uniref:Phage protein n=1 Tax=Streptococcus panodentis TaxID=1581472 RepID=A0ABS5AX42_9STRE|nr:hypothetical protein [Streptococcus panodentis]MBP2621144.1 hypothetical protein [Streptococcus panodentis]